MVKPLRLATRGSTLALWQATHVRDRLLAEAPEADVELVEIRTTGDRVTDVPLSRIGDRGLFTKEIDDAVLNGAADAAIHSLKDVPTLLAPGLALLAVLPREDPRDVFVPAPHVASRLADLPAGARVGTGALRRRAQIRALRPDLDVVELRGNLDTRLEKLRTGEVDGAVLALAGLRRLQREDAIGEALDPPAWLPAVGQGALAVIGRADAPPPSLAALDDRLTRAAVEAERAFLRSLEGGCQVPIGALATLQGDRLRMHGMVASLDGTRVLRADGERALTDPALPEAAALGERLAHELREQGAEELLSGIRGEAGPSLGAP